MSKGERESLVERFEEGNVDTIDTKARYLAYGARLKTALAASSRYLAYTSDVGEAFRPIVSPLVVKAAYGVSWAYLGLDVGYEGYKAVKAGKDEAAVGTMVVKRGIFQALASMAFPMMTIHSVVKYSAKSIFKHSKSTWGPTAMGLAVIPFLPYIFDEPVEHLVDKAFEPIERYVGSQTKVPHVAHQTVLEEKKVQ
ncbi:hypothetical protein VTP01DRAFT_432 [Rhizomucor pusillus]|uniref:uncharacterized protein n=1 Tax=Rhizomucor pusillus TaxID=4840 RepID=UPI0037424434